MKAITWEQKRQRQEPMRQQLVQLQVRLQVRLQVLVLELLFCRKRTKQQQR